MAEANDSSIGGGAEGYRPRHAAEQLDKGLMEALASAADQYRYQQMFEQYDAEFAIIRARLFSEGLVPEDELNAHIESQQRRIAESIGRQAMAKAYADSLRAQLYYVPPAGEEPYHGRHRLEDREEAAAPVWRPEEGVTVPHAPRHEAPEPAPPAVPEPPKQETPPPQMSVPEQGRLRHIIDDDSQTASLQPSPEEASSEEQAEEVSSPMPAQRERTGLFSWLRRAWYAGGAAIGAFFAHPEKGARRRAVVRTAAILGGVAAVLAIAEFADRTPDHIVQPPVVPEPAPQPAGPPPNTEEFFDMLKPYQYNGEPFEWTAAANHVGPAETTPKLLRLIGHARENGLTVDTWGDPDCGRWGINSVTVHLPDGTEKSYYDTPRKLAILKWYAGDMAPHFRP